MYSFEREAEEPRIARAEARSSRRWDAALSAAPDLGARRTRRYKPEVCRPMLPYLSGLEVLRVKAAAFGKPEA